MSSLQTEVIRSRLVDANPQDLDLLSGLIEDALPAGAGMMEIDATIAKARQAWAPLFKVAPVAEASAPPVNESTTARVVREAQARRARAEAAKTAPRAESNPFAAGSISVTQQVLIAARDPDRAKRLRAEAGR